MSEEYKEYLRGYSNGKNETLEKVYEVIRGALLTGRLKNEDDLKKIFEQYIK